MCVCVWGGGGVCSYKWNCSVTEIETNHLRVFKRIHNFSVCICNVLFNPAPSSATKLYFFPFVKCHPLRLLTPPYHMTHPPHAASHGGVTRSDRSTPLSTLFHIRELVSLWWTGDTVYSPPTQTTQFCSLGLLDDRANAFLGGSTNTPVLSSMVLDANVEHPARFVYKGLAKEERIEIVLMADVHEHPLTKERPTWCCERSPLCM